MGRRKTHAPLTVFLNNRKVGRLEKEASGSVKFQYAAEWLEWPSAFDISRSLPLNDVAYSGERVTAVFDNLLPDVPQIRTRVAERVGAKGADYYSLLEAIGRDCVGALQFLPNDAAPAGNNQISGVKLSEAEIEAMLNNLKFTPLGLDLDKDFRISVAGAQEKTALLFHDNLWLRPVGTTPTTHILKPQIGEIPTASGMIDMSDSVDNEHYCLKLLEAFALKVAKTEIKIFGDRRVLVVERFDRLWRKDGSLIRLPQEDLCQAMGIPSSQKYQNNGGPSVAQILRLLEGADDPHQDQIDFFKAQIIFWLIGATDGHAKNFSIFLKPSNRFSLTPFYDVLTAQPAFDQKQIPNNRYKLAMSAGKNRHYRLLEIAGRHFIETGKAAGMGPSLMKAALESIAEHIDEAPSKALKQMPEDFATEIHESVVAAITARKRFLDSAFAELGG